MSGGIVEGRELPRLVGDSSLLEDQSVALLTSVQVPPDLVLPILDLAVELGSRGVTIAGGFQTPLERAVFDLLLKRNQRIIVVLARTLRRFRVPTGWGRRIEDGRLLLVSATDERRITRETAEERNHLLTTIGDLLLVVHATPGGRAWRATSAAIIRGMPVTCLAHPANIDIEVLGATPVRRAAEVLAARR